MGLMTPGIPTFNLVRYKIHCSFYVADALDKEIRGWIALSSIWQTRIFIHKPGVSG